ncbi:hypothetical protein F3Y22_tig00110890pilonHSYRG00787 [Hibiscus syriacus]|uniref:Uncharacterized protein n=1 Tax=Hibiscus syriacus TaxID=106335 RepID=A0A6A2ZHH1_HIBSY|nr:hypothetical protein F3Y22_tig00110890pilonHSYRG00787 [Hibiscus syriacus]
MMFRDYVVGDLAQVRSMVKEILDGLLDDVDEVDNIQAANYLSAACEDIEFPEKFSESDCAPHEGSNLHNLNSQSSNDCHVQIVVDKVVGDGKEEYTDDDIDDIHKECVSYVANFIMP